MKKLLLALLFSASMFSQETFVKNYTSYVSQSKGVMQPWVALNLTVVFNANKTSDIIFYYSDGRKKILKQIGDVREDKTKGDDKYQIINVINEDGKEMSLQLFDSGTAMRLLIDDGYYIEFHND